MSRRRMPLSKAQQAFRPRLDAEVIEALSHNFGLRELEIQDFSRVKNVSQRICNNAYAVTEHRLPPDHDMS